jgi:hypothetical protein
MQVHPAIGKNMSPASTSVLQRHRVCIVICVFPLIALTITSAFLYNNISRSYYFEQKVHTYAMMETWLDLGDGMHHLANDVNGNKSALNQDVLTEFRILDAADRLSYMDVPHWQEWFSILTVYRGLRGMAFLHYFFNDSTGWVAQVYQGILLLDTAISNVPVLPITTSSGSYLYNQGANRFFLNETVVQNIGQVNGQLSTLIETNAGEDIFR